MKPLARLLSAFSLGTAVVYAGAEPLQVGAPVPAVAQQNQDGQVIKLAESGQSGYLLVYFYPKADTPGCTRQACSLRDAYADLTGVKIFGVSMDKVPAQKAFKDKYQLPFDLLADADGTVVRAFGVPATAGFAKRQAFLFRDGKLVWRDLAAATDRQAADILKVLKENKDATKPHGTQDAPPAKP